MLHKNGDAVFEIKLAISS